MARAAGRPLTPFGLPPYDEEGSCIHSGCSFLVMATNSKKPAVTAPAVGDPFFNLHHAEAEAELAKTTGGLGPTTNEYILSDEEADIDAAITPRDSQGFVRGENAANAPGSSAGDH